MNKVLKGILFLFQGRIIGTISGLIIALLVVRFGFVKAFFILSLTAIGYFVGSKLDSDEDLRSLLERILPPVD